MKKELLFKMLTTPSVSGYELAFQKMLINEMKDVDDLVLKHHSLNVVHVVNPNSSVKVMLLAHIDEIGLMIERVLDNGICKLTNVGAVRPEMYIGQHVNVVKYDEKGNYTYIPGVIGYTPNYVDGHVKVEDLNLDLGTSSKEESLKLVSVGDAVTHKDCYQELANDALASRALDDKISAFIGCEVLRKVKERSTNGVYLVTTVGEETTGRGAVFSTVDVTPTLAVALDVGSSSDVAYRNNFTREVSLGKGGMLTHNSASNKLLVKRLEKVANEKNIPVQYVVEVSKTYTDFDQVFKNNGGIPSTLISVPLRYMHSSVEVCSLKDAEYITDLLVEFICSLTENDTFNPFLEE
ncbi:MAG: M42 family peptidase [Bacilli bacterium]|nr:M42 family peptidase [Bacilli bacterium]